MSNENQMNGWRSDLRSIFAEIEREDKIFADGVEQVAHFYADTARPALEEVGRELARYGRKCETGEDAGRIFIIVHDAGDKVEFQYAVVAEVKIEGVTPYVHCWYEAAPTNQAQSTQQSGDDEQKRNEQQDQSPPDDKGGDDKKAQGPEQAPEGGKGASDEKKGADEKTDESKSSGEPERTKTIEPLAGWTERRALQDITRVEIVNDFIAHYREAIARLRAPMHAARG